MRSQPAPRSFRFGRAASLVVVALGVGAVAASCGDEENVVHPGPTTSSASGTGGGGAGGGAPTTTTTAPGGAGGSAGAAGAGGGAAAPGPWRVDNRILLDPYGRQANLHGLNMAGSHKADGGHSYLGTETAAFYQRMYDEGYRLLRFLTTWAAIMPTEGAIDTDYLDALEERLQWAADAGLVVILDMHQDLYGEGFTMPGWGYTIGDGAPVWSCPNDHLLSAEQSTWFLYYLDEAIADCFDHFWHDGPTQSYFAAAWAALAERLANHPNVIGIDPLNEPGWGSLLHQFEYETDHMVPLFAEVVATVRLHRPDLIAFVEPGARKNVTGSTTMTSLPFDNVVYAPHMYSASMEAGGEYIAGSHYGAFEQMLATDRAEADALDAALLIGEWGSGIANDENIAAFMGDIAGLLDTAAVSWTLWEAGPGEGYCLSSSLDTFKPWASALRRPYPERINGTGMSYLYDDGAETLTLHFQAGADRDLPTVIAVPTSLGAASLGESTNVAGLVPASPGELELYAESADSPVSATLAW